MGQLKEKGQGEVTRNLLKDRQLFVAATWVQTNDVTGFKSYEDLATKLTEVMGFTVTEGNVRNLLRITEKRLPAYDPPATQEQRILTLQAQVEDLTKRLETAADIATRAHTIALAAGQLFMVYVNMSTEAAAGRRDRAAILRQDLPERIDAVGELLAAAGALPVVLQKGK